MRRWREEGFRGFWVGLLDVLQPASKEGVVIQREQIKERGYFIALGQQFGPRLIFLNFTYGFRREFRVFESPRQNPSQRIVMMTRSLR
jgi:hypothetical protein